MMRYTTVVLAALLLAACTPGQGQLQVTDDRKIAEDVEQALAALPRAEVASLGTDGVPAFVRGHLWTAIPRPDDESLLPTLRAVSPVFRLDVANLRRLSVEHDLFGSTHVRYGQRFAGLDVIGGDLVLHVDAEGIVYAANGTARGGFALDVQPTLGAADALAVAGTEAAGLSLGMPRLVVLRESYAGGMHLAYEIVAKGEENGMPVVDRLYVDAHSGQLVDRHPEIHDAKVRKVHDARSKTNLPGTLVRSEGASATGDAVVDAAYDNLGITWDCFKQLLGRDSIDGSGSTLMASVHYSRNYANAFWDGQQMVFGDGDGTEMIALAYALDVTAHELGHGVTERSADLVYQNEPGALNEAMSDVFASACESFRDGAISANTWMIGEDIWTPGTPGDAFRYMDNPTADGMSYDFFPERYTGWQDNGGVHLNSGIANLAFKLMVAGGTHPRALTTTSVPAIGMEKAARIFYRALTVYMTSSTNFEGARAATAQAAGDLYDAATVSAVHAGWTAVGVPGAPANDGGGSDGDTGGGDTGGSTGALVSGVPVTGLSGNSGTELRYTLEVPAGATGLSFQMSGGTGDADLYVRFGSAPTTANYDYRPYLNGNNETATATAATAGTWHVMARGYSPFSGVSLVGTVQTGTAGGDTGGEVDPNALENGVSRTIAGSKNQELHFTFAVPPGAGAMSIRMSGGSGDADLYVRHGAAPTTSTYDHRPYVNGNNETVSVSGPAAGTWYVMVRGYSAFSGVALVASFEGGAESTPVPTTGTESEPNDSTSAADVIAAPGSLTGTLGSATDKDVFKVTASGTLQVNLTVPAGLDYDLVLYDASGSEVARSEKPAGQSEALSVNAGSGATFYALVFGYNGANSATQIYTLGMSW